MKKLILFVLFCVLYTQALFACPFCGCKHKKQILVKKAVKEKK